MFRYRTFLSALYGKKRPLPVSRLTASAGADVSCSFPDAGVQRRMRRGRAGRRRTGVRVVMCAVFFAVLYAGLAGRLVRVSFYGEDLPHPYAGISRTDMPLAEITDRNGTILAMNLPVTALEIAGREVWDAGEAALAVAGVLPGIDVQGLARRLEEGRYVRVAEDISPAARDAVFRAGIPGIHFVEQSGRFYPQGDLAAHVIGFTSPGRGGITGLERFAGSMHGAQEVLRASVDIRVQQILEEELELAMQHFAARAAWGIIMDVHTAEVIALASLPDFDPNAPGESPADFRRNRAVYDRYELGSAFKAITAAAAVDSGVAGEYSTYDTRGSFRVADRIFRDYRGQNRILTLSEIVQHSSNTGIAQVALEIGRERQQAYLEKLGLFAPLPVELHENRAPALPDRWGPVETVTIAYGHGIAVTPLHLAAAFSAVVNGGIYRTPTFIAGGSDGTYGTPVFSPRTSMIMRRILRKTVLAGSAAQAEVPGFFPAGKTATAEKPSPDGGYRKNTHISSFVGAVPGFAPQYVVLVSLDEPRPVEGTYGFTTAGWNAAPVFAKVAERMMPVLGIAPVSESGALPAFFRTGTGYDPEAEKKPSASRVLQ